MNHTVFTSITQPRQVKYFVILSPLFTVMFTGMFMVLLTALFTLLWTPRLSADEATDPELEQFVAAWGAARRGDHKSFRRIKKNLQAYVLYPYLQYEDYRQLRSKVPTDEMVEFLAGHEDWAFTSGLRKIWLKSLAKQGRWADLVANSDGVNNTVIQCQRARGQIILKQTDGLLSEAQNLWAVGKSQPDECDAVFSWLVKNDGIPASLAWERIRLAMVAGNPRLTLYLARFIPKNERRWLEGWQKFSRNNYSRLEQARNWPDTQITRMITEASLQRLARKDSEKAAKKFDLLDGHFNWGKERRSALLRDIALYTAVSLDKSTPEQMQRVPVAYRDSQLLEWWARYLLSKQDWPAVADLIGQMPADTRNDERWRYWLARAELESGMSAEPAQRLKSLASEANYFGFLAADEAGLPYNICPFKPQISQQEIQDLAGLDGFRRALALRKAQLDDWATREWAMAAARIAPEELKIVAALAVEEGWYDRAIFALGNSGDLRIYDWRFPLLWETEVKKYSKLNKLDPAWIYGTMRAESAMQVTARSSANALGLMQVTPDTGKRVAKKHGLAWSGSAQLKTVKGNIPIGTAYMGDLLRKYRHNAVLVSGAYNAGPSAVARWLKDRPLADTSIWVETLPYYETRDYIPRVLAFTTLYAWRMGGPVTRVSARMPNIESGKISINGTAEVVCTDQG